MKRIQQVIGLVAFGLLALACWPAPAEGETEEARYLSLYGSGEALRQAGDFRNAIGTFEDALALAGARRDSRGRLNCLLSLGILRWNVGQMDESASCHAQAMTLSRELRLAAQTSACSKILQIHSLYKNGKDAAISRRYQRSIRQFEAAIALARELGRPEFELKCLRQLSLDFFDLEKLEDFLALNKKSLAIALVLKHRTEEARCLNNIGLYFFKVNRYSKALTLYENALQILRRTDYYPEDKADCLNNIALIHLSLGNYDKALRYLQEAMELDLKMHDIASVALDLKNIGTVFRNKGENKKNYSDIRESLRYYLECLKLLKNNQHEHLHPDLVNNIGLTHFSLADYLTALDYFHLALDEATAARRVGDIGAIACNIGQAYLQMGNLAEARAYFIKSLELAVRSNREEILWETYLGLGQCFEEDLESASALSCFEKAADIIDTIRQQLSWDDQKTGFARDKWKVYEAWVDHLLQKRQTEPGSDIDLEIWRVVERAKARTLAEGLAQTENPGQMTPDPELLRERKRLTRNMSASISRLARRGLSSDERKSLLENLERDQDGYDTLKDRFAVDRDALSSPLPSSIISIDAVQRNLLDADSAIVEFFLGEKRSLVILITPEQMAVVPLSSRSTIEDSLRAYLKILATPPDNKFHGLKAGSRIYRELFSALDGRLGQFTKNLIIVPDGVLCYLPFETLVRGQSDSGEGKFLVESFQISYAPSVSSLALLAARQPASRESGRILAMGDPAYSPGNPREKPGQKTDSDVLREIYQDNGFDFSPLPFSKKEILQIRAVFPDNSVDAYLGSEAREELVKAHSLTDYRIIHFACHGFLDENAPQRSALVLSLDNDLEEDGFLQAREVYELRLSADLVVLSACQTGRGRLENGEGILGLPRMFFYAGARSTISSLWKISDRSTSYLMRDFYRHLAAGSDKARALREAKLKMLRSKFAHPFYWAGFILHGDYHSPSVSGPVGR